MNIAYFDCFAGISGDMTLGALVDLGLDVGELESMLKGLGIKSFNLKAERVKRHGIGAINLTVETEPEKHHRNLSHILDIIGSSTLSDKVKKSVENIFRKIAEAEGKIHGVPADKVTFHEVGALDSIIDIVGSVWGLEQMGIEKCYSSAISLGSGTVKCAHGILPVPAPATLEIVKGFPVVKKETGFEICTPTGAALVTTMAEYKARLPQMSIINTGYGCGDREFEHFPNILRIIIGKVEKEFEEDLKLVIETNIDDMNPEFYPYIIEKLLKTGAVDAFLTPALMKKGRPGNKLTVVADESFLNKCLNVIFSETSSFGVRIYETYRKKLPRSTELLKTPWGEISVKTYMLDGKKHIIPEYEECKKIAEKEDIPLKRIYAAIEKIGNRDD